MEESSSQQCAADLQLVAEAANALYARVGELETALALAESTAKRSAREVISLQRTATHAEASVAAAASASRALLEAEAGLQEANGKMAALQNEVEALRANARVATFGEQRIEAAVRQAVADALSIADAQQQLSMAEVRSELAAMTSRAVAAERTLDETRGELEIAHVELQNKSAALVRLKNEHEARLIQLSNRKTQSGAPAPQVPPPQPLATVASSEKAEKARKKFKSANQ